MIDVDSFKQAIMDLFRLPLDFEVGWKNLLTPYQVPGYGKDCDQIHALHAPNMSLMFSWDIGDYRLLIQYV